MQTSRAFFEKTPFKAETALFLEDINQKQGPKSAPWKYHMCDPFYDSLTYQFSPTEEDLILEVSDVIRCWGLAAYQMNQHR